MSKVAARIRRLILWLAGAAVVAAGIYVALRPRPVLVDVAPVDVGPLEVAVEEDAMTRIRERYVVSAPLGGRLLRITHDVGDSVIATQTVVARIEPTDPTLLDPREVAQAQARVRAAERKLAVAQAELEKAEAALQFAEIEMGRARQLRQTGAVSESEMAEKELLYRQAFEEVRAAGFAVDIAQYELELQEAALYLTDPDQKDELPDQKDELPDQKDELMVLEIEAPITGRILRIYQESTAIVQPGTELMEIGDPEDLEVVADVLSRDAVRIDEGDPVVLEHWGRDEPLHGRVRLVEPSGFTKVSALGVEEQRVNVVIDFVDPPEQRATLGDNFRVDSRIIIWHAERVPRIPTSSLFRVGDQWNVFTVVAGRALQVPVEIGQNNGQNAELIAGLQPQDVVIVHPSESVADGVPVAPR